MLPERTAANHSERKIEPQDDLNVSEAFHPGRNKTVLWETVSSRNDMGS